MGNIVLLDDLTINKIAAGEVIERPASVVKEMVENSIDAGATNITVEIKNGGISFIKVTDNGKGIAPDDLEIAFERHATSKIRSADDLNTVMSMGFRGEALASIAAIARVEMVSKTANQQNGYKIIVEGGKFLDMSETGCSTGTSITVTNLFYNTPVRYKFLRKDFTEAGYIEDAISRIALIHPEIAIKLINSGRTVIQTNGNGDLKSVIYSIYGKDVAEAVLEADYTYEDIHIKGVVGKPEIARSNRAYQLFYVNKRFIKDKSLSAAAEKAYKGLIPAGKFSILVLNIEMDPHKVDVNVHPAKLEVRFEDENTVFKAVYHAINQALMKANLLADSKVDTQHINLNSNLNGNLNGNLNSNLNGDLNSKLNSNLNPGFNSNMINTLNSQMPNSNRSADTITEKERIKEEKQPISSNLDTSNSSAETIVEQIYRQRQEQKWKSMLGFDENNKDQTSDGTIEHTSAQDSGKASDNNTGNNVVGSNLDNKVEPAIEKGQEILRKLQEMKANILKENTSLKAKSNETNNSQENLIYQHEETETYKTEENSVQQQNSAQPSMEQQVTAQEENAHYDLEKNMAENPQVEANTEINNTQENNVQTNNTQESNVQTNNTQESNTQTNYTQPSNVQTGNAQNNNIQQYNEQPQYSSKKLTSEYTPEFEEMYLKMFGTKPIKEEAHEEKSVSTLDDIATAENVSVFEGLSEYQMPTYKIIGKAFNEYIILEIEKEMYIIDQNAAREKLLYEKIKQNYYSNSIKDSQLLLLPDIITLSRKQMEIARDNIQMFKKAGFTLEEFGENTIKLTGVPGMCLDMETRDLFLEILDEINSVARTAKKEVEEKFIWTLACKVSSKLNLESTQEELESLIDNLLTLQDPFTCPFGKSVAIKMSKYDIERKFARK